MLWSVPSAPEPGTPRVSLTPAHWAAVPHFRPQTRAQWRNPGTGAPWRGVGGLPREAGTLQTGSPATTHKVRRPGFRSALEDGAPRQPPESTGPHQREMLLVAVVEVLHLFFERVHDLRVPRHVRGQDQRDHALGGGAERYSHGPSPQVLRAPPWAAPSAREASGNAWRGSQNPCPRLYKDAEPGGG